MRAGEQLKRLLVEFVDSPQVAAGVMLAAVAIDLPTLALAALASAVPGSPQTSEWSPSMLQACVTAVRAQAGGNARSGAPRHSDHRLVATADALGLTDVEVTAVALCLAAERDPEAARAVADAQSPIGLSRPLLGLAVSALAMLYFALRGRAEGEPRLLWQVGGIAGG